MARRRPAVLVVDEYPALGEVLCSLLREEGWTADYTQSVDEAVAPGGKRIDAILFDPTLVAPETARAQAEALRGRFGESIPLIVLGAGENGESVAEALGAVAFFRKPFRVELLLRRLRALLAPPSGGAGPTLTLGQRPTRNSSTPHR